MAELFFNGVFILAVFIGGLVTIAAGPAWGFIAFNVTIIVCFLLSYEAHKKIHKGLGSNYKLRKKIDKAWTGGGTINNCYSCNGDGKHTYDCNPCNGTGKFQKTCFVCHGSGKWRNKTCHKCNGTGHLVEECRKCKGTGQFIKPCKKCGGSGRYTAKR